MISCKGRILFISTMDSAPWGGSEELWSQAALRLLLDGFSVAASVVHWCPLDSRVQLMKELGVTISTRPQHPSLWDRAWGKITGARKGPAAAAIEKLINLERPQLIVHSSGTVFPYPDLVEVC